MYAVKQEAVDTEDDKSSVLSSCAPSPAPSECHTSGMLFTKGLHATSGKILPACFFLFTDKYLGFDKQTTGISVFLDRTKQQMDLSQEAPLYPIIFERN